EEDDKRVREVRCLVKEAKTRIEDPKGGAWRIVENLRARVEALERNAIRAATTLMQLQRD
ncbi:hypothetical protein HAX54_006095, partial [Datura stramonium]|nr:hypothetical protein [Datura stramonium]